MNILKLILLLVAMAFIDGITVMTRDLVPLPIGRIVNAAIVLLGLWKLVSEPTSK